MRIVHVVDYLMPGLGYQELLLPKWNARHGHDVHIVTSDRYAPIQDYEQTWGRILGPRRCGVGESQIEGVAVHRLACVWEAKRRPWLRGLEERVETLNPDVIFCHGTAAPTSFRVARLATRRRMPLLMDNHETFVAQNTGWMGRAYYGLLRRLAPVLRKASYRFLGVAEECCEFLELRQGIPRSQIQCLPLGVDTDLFRVRPAARSRLRAEMGIPHDAVVVMQTGKLSRDKGPHILSAAMASLMAEQRELWLVFVGAGAGDYLEEVRHPLLDAQVLDRARFVPFVPASDLADWYSVADVCVYPGGSSLSSLEGAACGRVVVMTDLPAGRWRAEHGVGLCFRDGDVLDLRRTLGLLVPDSDRRDRIGNESRISVEAHFSYDQVATEAEQLMQQAIAARR